MSEEEKKALEITTYFNREEATIYYSNFVTVTRGPFDVTLAFGKAIMDPAKFSAGETVINQKVEVLIQLSPEHANSLLVLLKEQLEQYEKAKKAQTQNRPKNPH